jgi:hypothetical protein
MEIKARYIMLGPSETEADVQSYVEKGRTSTLAELEATGASDFQRASRRESLTLAELYGELRAIIRPLEVDPDLAIEYFSDMVRYDIHEAEHRKYAQDPRPIPTLTEQTKLEDIRYRWIAVFPVTGGNEGHYVHIDLVWQEDYREGRISLFLLKTFGGHDAAVKLAGLLARVLGV